MIGAVYAEDAVPDDIVIDADDDNLKITENYVYTADEAGSFSDLENDIDSAGDNFNISRNYKFSEDDNSSGVNIHQDNLIINGNNYILDGNNQSRIFNITGNNVTISNLVFMNANAYKGGAIYSTGKIILNNITFINNWVTENGGAIYNYQSTVICSNSRFIDNYALGGSSVYLEGKPGSATLEMCNTYITSKIFNKYGQIKAKNNCTVNLDNITFVNLNASYSPALYSMAGFNTVTNSKFINITANISAGAIAIKEGKNLYIENCEFINTSSSKNSGAVFADIAGPYGEDGDVTILNSVFKNTRSGFGGAFIQLGGNLFINNSDFINNKAVYNGGAVYLSFTDSIINNCTFDSGSVDIIDDYLTYGGALYIDWTTLVLNNSKLTNNFASLGNAIFACDSFYNITNTEFKNNTNAIYSIFDNGYYFENNTFNNETISTNNTIYATIISTTGKELSLLNNTINVDTIPTKFDLRDWGWVSPVRNQGEIGSCWSFGMTGPFESALLKACGITTDFSENNMRNTMIKYSLYGTLLTGEGGSNILGSAYFLSWLGAFSQDADEYDEVGKLSPLMTTNQDIHIQDIKYVSNDEIPNGTQMKLAILQYGSIDASYSGQSKAGENNPYFNPATCAQYTDIPLGAGHEISIVGWDDSYSADNFLIRPEGDGAWIVKNSWGEAWGDHGYFYLSYYDKTLLATPSITDSAAVIIVENTVNYNKNYQYDIVWLGETSDLENTSYANQYEALDDDLIAAVGTYFQCEGVDYTVEIYVNDQLKLTQNGVSPFWGFHTIKLNEYIPIKKGDVFKAVITTRYVPLIDFDTTRVHYTDNISFIYENGSWVDLYYKNKVACLKVYTVADDTKIVNNKDISVDYDGGYFSVKVVTANGHAVGAGEKVKFTINGKTTTATTDNNGIAKIKISDIPKKYTITTQYNGKTYKNTVTVNHILKTGKVSVKKTAKKFILKATLKINGKAVKGKKITFKFKGKTYKTKTNAKGIAKVTVKKNVIKKLKKGKKYTFQVTYLKDTIKSNVKIK